MKQIDVFPQSQTHSNLLQWLFLFQPRSWFSWFDVVAGEQPRSSIHYLCTLHDIKQRHLKGGRWRGTKQGHLLKTCTAFGLDSGCWPIGRLLPTSWNKTALDKAQCKRPCFVFFVCFLNISYSGICISYPPWLPLLNIIKENTNINI